MPGDLPSLNGFLTSGVLTPLQEAAAAGKRPRVGGPLHIAAARRHPHAVRLLELGAARLSAPSWQRHLPAAWLHGKAPRLLCSVASLSDVPILSLCAMCDASPLSIEQVLKENSVFLPTTTANGLAMTGTFQNGTSFYVRPPNPFV